MIRDFVTLAIIATTIVCMGTSRGSSRTCRIVFPDRPGGSPKMAFLYDGSKNTRVSLPSMNLSEVIDLPDGELTIALTTGQVESPELLPDSAPKLKIRKNVGDFYIILTADPKNQHLPVKMNLADVGGGKIRNGETLWFNFTAHRIVAKLGQADMSVAPLGKAVSKPPASESGYYVAQFAYQAQGESPLARITEQNWWHDDKAISLGFIIETGGRLPRIFTFRDFRIPVEASQSSQEELGAQPVARE